MDAIVSSVTVSFINRKSGWSFLILIKLDIFQKSDFIKLKYLNLSTLKIDQKRISVKS